MLAKEVGEILMGAIIFNIECRINDLEALKKVIEEIRESYPNASINIRVTR